MGLDHARKQKKTLEYHFIPSPERLVKCATTLLAKSPFSELYPSPPERSRRRPSTRSKARPYLFDNLPNGAIGVDHLTGKLIFLADNRLDSDLSYQARRFKEAHAGTHWTIDWPQTKTK